MKEITIQVSSDEETTTFVVYPPQEKRIRELALQNGLPIAATVEWLIRDAIEFKCEGLGVMGNARKHLSWWRISQVKP